MTASILAISVAVIGLVVWLVKRAVTNHDDPIEQHRARVEQAKQDVARKDGDAASAHGLDDLDELDRLQASRSNPQR